MKPSAVRYEPVRFRQRHHEPESAGCGHRQDSCDEATRHFSQAYSARLVSMKRFLIMKSWNRFRAWIRPAA
ncbi:hypothetical protein WP1_095 [Pseudomonas phage WP1]